MHRAKRPRGRKRPPKAQSSRSRAIRVLRLIWQSLAKWAESFRSLPWWADVLGVTVILWGFYQARISLIPVVEPDAAISSSWLDLPITIRNPGDVFDFKNVQFFCDMTEQQFEGNRESKKFFNYNYYRIKGLVEWPIRQPPLTISAGNTSSFPCNIAANSVLKFDDVPLPMRLIHLSIKTKYNINLGLFQWPREAQSQTFTWKQVSGGWQWLPGETLPGPS
jgi:hypothetical protein